MPREILLPESYYRGRRIDLRRRSPPLEVPHEDPAIEKNHVLGDLQHAIMRVLWDAGEATVAEVRDALSDERDRALTTIATMLTKLEKKGVVAHRTEGRQYVYRPSVTEAEVTRSMVSDLTNRVFDGDAAALVSHLLSEHEIDAGELTRLIQKIEERGEEETR